MRISSVYTVVYGLLHSVKQAVYTFGTGLVNAVTTNEKFCFSPQFMEKVISELLLSQELVWCEGGRRDVPQSKVPPKD